MKSSPLEGKSYGEPKRNSAAREVNVDCCVCLSSIHTARQKLIRPYTHRHRNDRPLLCFALLTFARFFWCAWFHHTLEYMCARSRNTARLQSEKQAHRERERERARERLESDCLAVRMGPTLFFASHMFYYVSRGSLNKSCYFFFGARALDTIALDLFLVAFLLLSNFIFTLCQFIRY